VYVVRRVVNVTQWWSLDIIDTAARQYLIVLGYVEQET